MAGDNHRRSPRAVPLTVLGGYLGAGKTTLINRMLYSAASRIAVVVNDFGSVNIDADLIRSQRGDVLELANGCICCDLSGGMSKVVDDLASMQSPPEHVLVEVSGVGDPGPVAAWGDHPGFCRAGVLACADVETIQARAHDRWVADTVMAQLRSADLLLLTKTDLAGPDRTKEVAAWLRAVAPGIPVTSTAGLDLCGLLDLPEGPVSGAAHRPGQHARHASITLRGDAVLPRAEVTRRLAGLPPDIVRAKGFVRLSESPERFTLVQVVGARHTLADAGPWDGGRIAGLVVIAAPVPDAGEILASVAARWPELTEQPR